MSKRIFFIEKNKEIFKEDFVVLHNMYQPIIGVVPIALFELLFDLDFLNKGVMNAQYDESILLRTLSLSENDFLVARKKLEAVGLLRTFERADGKAVIFTINKPLRSSDFIKNSFLLSELKRKLNDIDIERIVFGTKQRTFEKVDYLESTTKYQDIFELTAHIPDSVSTLEIEIPKSLNKDEAIRSLTTAQFSLFLTNKRISPSKISLINVLSSLGFSSTSLNIIFDYAYQKNGKLINRYIETIANDLFKKNTLDALDVEAELKQAMNSLQRNKKIITQEQRKQKDKLKNVEWDEIFSELGDEL